MTNYYWVSNSEEAKTAISTYKNVILVKGDKLSFWVNETLKNISSAVLEAQKKGRHIEVVGWTGDSLEVLFFRGGVLMESLVNFASLEELRNIIVRVYKYL